MNVHHLYDRWTRFSETEVGRRTGWTLRAVFVACVAGLLVYQLSRIGWATIVSSLPTEPLFYVLILAMYLLLPVTEAIIYGPLWSLKPLRCLGVMIRKRVLNVDVVGYSGEVYLYLWAKDRVAYPDRKVMGTIKDNLIISSLASLSAAAILIIGLLLSGQIRLSELMETPAPLNVGLGLVGITLAGYVVYRFRSSIFTLPKVVLRKVGAAHVLRFLAGYALQIAAWWIVIPDASFRTWAVLLVVFVVINRVPFMPSSDLVFVSAGAGMAPLLDIPVAAAASMLLARSATDRLLNIGFFASSVWIDRHSVSSRREAHVNTDRADGAEIADRVRTAGEPLNS